MEGKNGIISVTFFLNDPAAEANADKQLHGLEMTILGPLSLQTIKKGSQEDLCEYVHVYGCCNAGLFKEKFVTAHKIKRYCVEESNFGCR